MAGRARRSGPLRGGKRGDVYRIGGIDVPFDPQLDLEAPRPSPLQPESKTGPPKPLSAKEKVEVTHFLKIREKMRKGPLHTVLGDQARVGSRTGGRGAAFDAFNGMGGYSERYAPRRNVLPQLKGRIFVKEFFPRELWATIESEGQKEGERGKGAERGNYRRKSSQKVDNNKKLEELEHLENELDDGRDGDVRERDSEDEAAEEEVDEEFDEEDDEGGDYNAEQYFDGGGEDEADDIDAGEDGGIDYF